MDRDPPHYLKPLKTTTTPKRLLWLDCNAQTAREQGATVARFNVAALGTSRMSERTSKWTHTIDTYDNVEQVWEHADRFCTHGRRTVLFAYDLPQQIRVSQAMLWLPRMGWTLESLVLTAASAWAQYRDGKRTLLLCDLKSWAPVDLAVIGSDVTHGRVRILDATAGPAFHLDLCKARALCIRDAVLQILAWIEGENLGRFRPTGAGQSYAAYRRRFMRTQLLVHDDAERLAAERAAMWTGRCEAWRHGKLVSGPYVEYDMSAAYCRIAAECDVPTVARGGSRTTTVPMLKRWMLTHAVLAHVTVTTDVPIVPTRYGGRTLWPTGTFDTWLWDPELQLCFDHATAIKVHRAYKYDRRPALQDFARFALAGMGEQTQVYGLVPRRVMKHWSRCLVGRLGLRYRTWEPHSSGDGYDVGLVTYVDMEEHTTTDLLQAGRDWFILTDMQEAAESLPQIPSWVMSECRRRLWIAMDTVGLDKVVYIDTDSIILHDYPEFASVFLSAGRGTWTWSRKGRYDRMTIHGPRNYSTDTARHVSGLPLTARQVAPLEFTGEVMRSIKESMRAGQLDRVTSIPRRFILDAPDLRRQHLPDGTTTPFHVQPSITREDYL